MRIGIVLFLLAGVNVLADPNSICGMYDKPGEYPVEMQHLDWMDTGRSRNIPVTIYMPKGDGPFAVILFSHGLGGSRDGYAYLGHYWASWGYCCVHVQHPGSDAELLRNIAPEQKQKVLKKAANLQNATARVQDMYFALSMLEEINKKPPYEGKLDLTRVGIAGHSFGAQTTLVMSGAGYGRGVTVDKRIKAAIPMGTPIVGGLLGFFQKRGLRGVSVPCLHMTGTLDGESISGTKAAERRIPFDIIDKADQYLIIINGADHMVFAGASSPSTDRSKDKLIHKLIMDSTMTFWKAYLDGDTLAKESLQKGYFQSCLDSNATLEEKLMPAGK